MRNPLVDPSASDDCLEGRTWLTIPARLRHPRWDARRESSDLILAGLVVVLLTPPDTPILQAVDETLIRRHRPKVFAILFW